MNTGLDLKNKKVLVVGLARSGIGAAILLKSLGADVLVSDVKDDQKARIDKDRLTKYRIDVELGKHSRGLFESVDLVVVSPGVRSDSECLGWSRSKNIPVIAEIELAAGLCPAPIIAVTGTNGKTTTVILIAKVLGSIGKKVHVCGNIGQAFSEGLKKIAKDDIVCLEVSSFQLETIIDFKPKASVVLNLSRNHLDRHKDLNDYVNAKKRIFVNQDESDFIILNKDDSLVKDFASGSKARVSFFTSFLEISGVRLDANQSAAFAVGKIFGVKKEKALKALSDFRGLAHRLELIDTIEGVDYINDSKSTTVESLSWALRNIYKPVILIAGGRDKGADFAPIKDLVRAKIKTLILIGEAKDKIRDAYKGIVPILDAESLAKATDMAKGMTNEGDCVLLSPMCASFDMFSDYQERGNIFKQIVKRLKKS